MIGQMGKSVNQTPMPDRRKVLSGMTSRIIAERGRLLLFFGCILVGVVSFEAGFLRGAEISAKPVVISTPPCTALQVEATLGTSGENVAPSATATGTDQAVTSRCAFVGSRNSTLYHLPSCASAKRIKPENIVCFISEEDAQAKGYKAGCMK